MVQWREGLRPPHPQPRVSPSQGPTGEAAGKEEQGSRELSARVQAALPLLYLPCLRRTSCAPGSPSATQPGWALTGPWGPQGEVCPGLGAFPPDASTSELFSLRSF